MATIVPAARPAWNRDKVVNRLAARGVVASVALLGVRGYYRDTMGVVGRNDVGIYDDAIFVVSPAGCVSFNANTDPSITRSRVATLKLGVWRYKMGIHGLSKPPERRYRALVQAGPVTVHRHGAGDDTGWFGINIHRGGWRSTSSEGCQTIYPDQWAAFVALVEGELRRHGLRELPYALMEGQG